MKIVTSDIQGFTGRVLLKDKLFWEDVSAIEGAQDKAAELEESAFLVGIQKARGEWKEGDKLTWSSKTDHLFIAAILQCAERFEIEGMEEKPTLENFPMTPRKNATEFVSLVWAALQEIYYGEMTIPNES